MAINEPGGQGGDPGRGTGDDKVTQAAPKGFEAAPGVQDKEPPGSSAGDPARGGCMKFGWGCLPVLLVVAMPMGLFL